MRCIEAKEKSGPRNPDAEAKAELTDEMIRDTGAQFGVDLKDAQDLLAMRNPMSRNTFADRDQILQSALTKAHMRTERVACGNRRLFAGAAHAECSH